MSKVRIVIEVSGGLVQQIYASDPYVEVDVLDYDVDNEEDEAEVEAQGERVQEDVAAGRLVSLSY